MCGIAGIVSKASSSDFKEHLASFEQATYLMAHRGPDNYGKLILDNIALFHYRLSILDLDIRSNQPFNTKNSEITTVYNGELYNFLDLKRKYGIETKTTSDTEILVETYSLKGSQAFTEWNGIFAAAFYDRKLETLTLVRDRFGVKPLYYSENQDYFMFASEAKVLYSFMNCVHLNRQALAEYLWFGNTISGNTLVDGVKKLSPGTHIEYNLKTKKTFADKYWELPGSKPFRGGFTDASNQTRTLLEQAVKSQLLSDVDVGVFLSGGIDSSAITAFASKHYATKINTYSVDFDYSTKASSELEKARYVAKWFGTAHHEVKVEAKDISHIVEHLVYQHDEPFADAANIPLYILTNQLKGELSVVLQGDGGDEIFAGYRRYNLMNDYVSWKLAFRIGSCLPVPSRAKQRLNRMHGAFNNRQPGIMLGLLNTMETLQEGVLKALSPDFRQQLLGLDPFHEYKKVEAMWHDEDLVQRLLYTDTRILLPNTYLDKVDKSTMANSIEARVPFLDNELTEFALALPGPLKVRNKQKKYILRQALRGVIPDQILDAPKKGFGVPYAKWLASDLYELAQTSFEHPLARQVLNTNYLSKQLSEHRKQIGRDGIMLWKVLILALWLQRYESKLIL